VTYSPDHGAGVEVNSWGAHDQVIGFTAWPRALKTEIKRRFGEHPMGIEIPVDKSVAERMRVRSDLVAGVEIKSELVSWLLTSYDWDFLISVFGESHRGGHILWPNGDESESTISPSALLDVYIALDRALGDVLAAIDLTRTTVVLFALHGMGPNLSQEHFVAPLMDRVNVRFSELEPSLFAQAGPPRQRSAMRFLRENLPPRLQTIIANLVPQHVRDRVVDSSFTSGYDWPHTPGLALRSDFSGYLRFNVKGREKIGMLEAGSAALSRYEDLIRDSFLSLCNDKGEPLVREVFNAAERFPGARSDRLPDLIVTWKDLAPASYVSSSLGTLEAHLDTGRGGNHRTTGFQILIEPGAERAREAPPLALTDFAPSIMRLLDW
jgi:predicted AlkP superfamily phosphohydrolase/phosphomutase